MRKLLSTCFIAVSILVLNGCGAGDQINQIGFVPLPTEISLEKGETTINQEWAIIENGGHDDLRSLKELLAENLAVDYGISVSRQGGQKIALNIEPDNPTFGKEGYALAVSEDGVKINAGTPNGIFYGIQTLRQLLDSGDKTDGGITINQLTVNDAPRFQWRGMHLDVARHFFDVKFVKRYIDYLAMHKMNIFHWHLTEDQGWRVAIDQYPKLAEISAYRDESLIGHYRDKPRQYDGKRYGGFYSKDEMREVVQYAKGRYITVVPEIEMPGHAKAALAAYPELSCTGGPHKVEKLWGVHKEVFCAGKKETFEFLENVLTEVATIFPGPYVHIGGDECPKNRWKEHDLDQQRIAAEGLHDEHELQSYFIKRIEGILNGLGKRLIGWDEILEGGLAPGAIVQSWRGMDGGIAAANAGHEVIMSPTSHAYFDYYQSEDKENEPLAIGGFLPLEKVYQFEPVPPEIDQDKLHYILGGQGNVWTEYISTPEKAEYMAIPRMSAMAEVLWSQEKDRDYESFTSRMKWQYKRLDRMKVNYRKPE
ncbi:MAG: beta-N-acetylhexosaminidase [Candidatus Marinimicrobia bacterium]|jgi:hexosaminidase|nr:beta-N-acetylhexosaminidase [Candidatus Neomarinimicrobiota bacterium]MDP6611223.1 beta-N-acetylhexosaminidase [Candidatus Neomarinimicrobiota bacterium]|tara:strand:- start:22683 stop:24293 length:1611 start_codon:yes stop_codon:yes gene_type:complete